MYLNKNIESNQHKTFPMGVVCVYFCNAILSYVRRWNQHLNIVGIFILLGWSLLSNAPYLKELFFVAFISKIQIIFSKFTLDRQVKDLHLNCIKVWSSLKNWSQVKVPCALHCQSSIKSYFYWVINICCKRFKLRVTIGFGTLISNIITSFMVSLATVLVFVLFSNILKEPKSRWVLRYSPSRSPLLTPPNISNCNDGRRILSKSTMTSPLSCPVHTHGHTIVHACTSKQSLPSP